MAGGILAEKSRPDSPEDWEKTKTEFFKDRDKLNELIVKNSKTLIDPLEWDNGQIYLDKHSES